MIKSLFSLKCRFFSFKHVKIEFDDKARYMLWRGIEDVNKTVSITLGPKGKNAAIEYELGPPKITKDGVTVVKHIEFPDNQRDLGCRLIKFPAHESNNHAGDGTTTTTIIASHLIEKGLKYLKRGVHPIALKESLVYASNLVENYLKSKCIPVTSESELLAIAKVSCNHDEYNANLVTQAVLSTGKNGTIMIEEGADFDNALILADGFTMMRGAANEFFMQNQGHPDIRLENPLILTCAFKIHKLDQIINILEYAKKTGRSLVIAAEDIDKEALSTILLNHQKGELQICAINFPYEHNIEILYDFSSIVGSKVHSELTFKTYSPDDLGSARRVNIERDQTLVFGGKGDPKERIETIENDLRNTQDHDQRSVYKIRLQRLYGKMAVIEIGIGGGQMEIQERRDRVVDSLNSVKTALSEGFLPGGGSALLYAARMLSKIRTNTEKDIGVRILQESLMLPCEQIVINTDYGLAAIDEMWNSEDEEIGLNANTGKLVNLIDEGIIDSAHVVIQALRGACSLAQLVLSTSAVIVREKKYVPTLLSEYRKELF
ncbi:unnamed protein product [Blepharisma stoltei]|uniref:Uncharacterized protein n=1 Tax=Blepharisma stoltei TaxID=1481888 RepID=A0AAU9K423_9CILI|nr:unnamed protein product [Blepharisma stoltei]